MTQTRVLNDNENPEPKKESFKAWKDEEKKKPRVGGRGYERKFKKGNKAKVILSPEEIDELERLSESAKSKLMVKAAQEKEVRKRLNMGEDEPIPKQWLYGGSKFDMPAMKIFCDHYSKTSLMSKAAELAGVSVHTVHHARKTNPMFMDMIEEAKTIYRDKIVSTVYQRAVEGVDEPIIGGMGRDQIVAYKRVYSDRLLELEAKRVEHGYRDKGGLEINTGGGVLVVQAGNMSEGGWEEKYGKMEEASEESSPASSVP